MFTSKNVACYLNGFAGHGEDPENKELKLVFHVNGITPELASEISPRLADRIFRNEGGEINPAKEISKAAFTSMQIQMQNITFHALPDPPKRDKGVLVPGCAISNLRAARDTSGGFRLEFDVVMPMDVSTMRLVEDFYKATCFLSMEPIQREIELEKDEEAQQSLQDAADGADETVPETEKEKPRRRGRKKTEGEATL